MLASLRLTSVSCVLRQLCWLCPCFVLQVEQLIDIVDGALVKASQVAGQVGYILDKFKQQGRYFRGS
jgi:hypothetical protein